MEVKSGNTVISYTYDDKGRKISESVNDVVYSTITYDNYTVNTEENYRLLSGETRVYKQDGTDISFKSSRKLLSNSKIEQSLAVNGEQLYCKTYDTKDRLESLNNGGVISNFTYDDKDRVTAVNNPAVKESYDYDEYDKLWLKKLSETVTHTYAYHYADNYRRDLKLIAFGNYGFAPLWDANGRNIGKEILNGNKKIAAEYITYRKIGDHGTTMPATVWFGSGNEVKDSIKYKYDKCGNICEITENGHLVAKYAYDSLNRLVREDNKLLDRTTVFTYDRCGNITERCEYAYTAKTGDELSELECTHFSYDYDGDKLISYNGEQCAYNSLGNPTTYRGKTCEWQYGNRLTKFGDVTFAYDGLGRRIKREALSYTYDSDGKLVKQSNGMEFIYDDKGVVGFILGEQYFYRKDVLGNIVAILDKNGAVVVRYIYDAWGNHAIVDKDGHDVSETSTVGNMNPFRYRGYYYDSNTGLYYLQSRYYDPDTGRFISQDNLDFADHESINGLNLYAYCANNPIMNIDPTGAFFLLALAVGAIAGAVIGATVSGVKAAKSGASGWEIFGATMRGMFCGAVIGAAAGAIIGIGGEIISAGLSIISGAGGLSFALASGGSLAAAAVAGVATVGFGVAVVGAGTAAALNGLYLFAKWQPGSWPGDDPTIPPGDGFQWRGKGPVGSDKGAWYNSFTKDSLHPDLNHPSGIPPHWDWINKLYKICKRIFPH